MKFINTDGMAFIGPGSEWFWTALSGIILAVTFIAIYRQLRLQRSQGAIEQLDAFERELNSERQLRYFVEVQRALRDGTDPAHLPDAPASSLASFWEKVAHLARRGHIDARLLWQGGSGSSCQLYWVTLQPWVRRRREENGPLLFTEFEWLARVMTEMDRRSGGLLATMDAAAVARRGQRDLAMAEGLIRVEEALRSVLVASPEAPTAA